MNYLRILTKISKTHTFTYWTIQVPLKILTNKTHTL